MMRDSSLLLRSQLFISTAAIAAHAGIATSPNSGFRQRDVRFLFELFSNWAELTSTLVAKNTQIQRFLDSLHNEGFAKRFLRKSQPHYRLTRTGLIELISRIVNQTYCSKPEHFFFLNYFIKSYKPHIEEIVKSEGQQFPYSLKLELDNLLDAHALLEREIRAVQLNIDKLQARVDDAISTSELVRGNDKKGVEFEETVLEVQKLYPYELNSQKPLTELIASIPEKNRRWELESGSIFRTKLIWQSNEEILNAYLRRLQSLLQS